MKTSFAQITVHFVTSARHLAVVLVYSIVVMLAVSITSNVAFAQCIPPSSPGSLDTCFGIGGKVITDITNGTANTNARAVAIQTDGKIVIASSWAHAFYVLRYDSAGLLDLTFGSGGVVRISFDKNSDVNANALAVQSDGKIIVAGYATLKGTTTGFAIARLNTNGSLDTSFGNAGKIVFGFKNNAGAHANGITIQANGYVVVAGESGTDFALARLTPSGAFDLGFNGTGKVTVSTATSTDLFGGANDVTIQTVSNQEKLVVAGTRPSLAGVARDIAVLRFNPNGSLDSSFGGGGKVFTDFYGYSDGGSAVAIDANNNIVVAGGARTDGLTDLTTDNRRFALVRYTENGQLDASFGNGGKVTAGVVGYRNFVYGHGLAIQADGRIAISGIVESIDTITYADFAVARFNPNGTLDTTFGSDATGIVLTNFAGGQDRAWGGLARQADGRIVVVGAADLGFSQIGLARYMP